MSWFTMSALTCPACAQAFEVPTADTVNVTRLPAHRGHVLKGNFHRFACPACSHAIRVERDFLYTDLDRAQMVQVHRPDTEKDWRHAEKETLAAFHAAVDNGPPGVVDFAVTTRLRTVFGLDELAEKVLLWEHGLDDGLVELLKLELMMAMPELRRKLDIRLVITTVRDRDGELWAREGDGGQYALPLARLRELAATRGALTERFPGLFYRPWVSFKRLAFEAPEHGPEPEAERAPSADAGAEPMAPAFPERRQGAQTP